MIRLIAILTLMILSYASGLKAPSSSFLSIRKDYECEIVEKDFFIKDCYRNADLNWDERKMIASIKNAR